MPQKPRLADRYDVANDQPAGAEEAFAGAVRLVFGGGDGHPPGMDERVIRLEVIAEQAERRTERIELKLDAIVDRLARLPTIAGLWGMVATVLAVAVAMIAAFIAILAYLQDQRIAASNSPPTPIVVQVPPPVVIQVPAPAGAPPAPSK